MTVSNDVVRRQACQVYFRTYHWADVAAGGIARLVEVSRPHSVHSLLINLQVYRTMYRGDEGGEGEGESRVDGTRTRVGITLTHTLSTYLDLGFVSVAISTITLLQKHSASSLRSLAMRGNK